MQQHFRESEKESTAPTITGDTQAGTPVESSAQNFGAVSVPANQGITVNAGQRLASARVLARCVTVFTVKDILTCGITGASYGAISLIFLALSRIVNFKSASGFSFTVTMLAVAFIVICASVLPFNYGWHRKDWRQGVLMAAAIIPLGMTGMHAGSALGDWFVHDRGGIDARFLVFVEELALAAGIVGGIGGRLAEWRRGHTNLRR